jgi:hypothetical protein
MTLKLSTRFGLPAQLKFAAIGGEADIAGASRARLIEAFDPKLPTGLSDRPRDGSVV